MSIFRVKMTTIVILLFILQLISFSFLFLLYLKVKAKETKALESEKMYEEMQKSLVVYIDEMKKENDRFLQAIDQQQKHRSEVDEGDQESDETKSESVEEDQKEEQWKNRRVVPPTLAHQRYKKERDVNQKQREESSQKEEKEDPVLMLHKEGYSIEEIAKKLELGKTEVELHIKFRA